MNARLESTCHLGRWSIAVWLLAVNAAPSPGVHVVPRPVGTLILQSQAILIMKLR